MMTPRSLAIATLLVAGAAQAAPAPRPDTGYTSKGPGYVTLPLKSVLRCSVKSDRDTGAKREPRGVLAIVEAEFYESPRNP